ncbi:hypothetical protein [Shewanella fidelis]|uniref:Uncharacterized protein n=1 Tax=Shewanella fidelis TaxID=173509 RepID=A0AAW8NK58_9GAMM|nr:hypothetical protein [Shewanella fidelis]MDR8522770.1 hypothetical protein [Shewanella fidelis]MDW4812385.1 hypothetical protein [Shewanella fidelis]MDW4815950.1 hypothetical protein [Shewanella fidelis]MDW4820626.1 hypothetical protein [Shewanella fidelis]MDW4824848.1 hypothetical protein [Shewanella fidelis]
MLNKYKIDELIRFFTQKNIPLCEHEIIIRELEYDMWDFKVRESNADQRAQLKLIQKNAASLLSRLKSISWELSSELHELFEDEYRLDSVVEAEESNFEEDSIDSKFIKALEENADNRILQNIYDEAVSSAFYEVPIDGPANALDYINKLASTCQRLIDKKSDSKDKGIYPALQSRWDSIGKKHNIEVNKTNSIEFISVCIGKDVETVKKQYLRLDIRPYTTVKLELIEIINLENLILERYRDDWKQLLNLPKFNNLADNVNIHCILADSFQEKKAEYSNYKKYLRFLSDEGIRDIIGEHN